MRKIIKYNVLENKIALKEKSARKTTKKKNISQENAESVEKYTASFRNELRKNSRKLYAKKIELPKSVKGKTNRFEPR